MTLLLVHGTVGMRAVIGCLSARRARELTVSCRVALPPAIIPVAGLGRNPAVSGGMLGTWGLRFISPERSGG